MLDELHTYRGVFGSHLANVLRRLARVAEFYGSKPQFICCSATIANPGELAAQLIEREVEVVEENGAPAAEKLFVFYNPPMVNRNLGIRRSYLNETTRVAKELLARKLQTIVFANSRLHTEVLLTYLQQANPPAAGAAGADSRLSRRIFAGRAARNRARAARRARSRRGGDERAGTGHRYRLARCVRDGGICRIDCFHMAARRARGAAQRNVVRGAGGIVRAARSIHRAASRLFFRALAGARLRAAGQSRNSGESSEVRGVRAAALAGGTISASVDLPELCERLGEAGFLHRSGGNWHWVQEAYPADTVSLRSVTSDNFVIIDTTGRDDGE